MPVNVFQAFSDVINQTASAVVDSQILPKYGEIVNTFVTASFDAAQTVVTQVRDLTAPTVPPPGP